MDEVSGGVTYDKQGGYNGIRINCADISNAANTWDSHFFSFRLKRNAKMPVFLRIWLNNPMPATHVIFIDEMCIVAGTELYDGGPYAAAFPGATPAVNEDNWDLTVTNDRAGQLQEWYHRAFDMADKGLLLPSSGTGTQVPDTVIG